MSGVVHVINFSHPMTEEQRMKIMELTGAQIGSSCDLPVQVDFTRPLAPQIAELVDKVGFSAEEWETLPVVILPPGSSQVAVILVAELYKRLGKFPVCVIRASSGMPPVFVVTEIVDLNEVAGQR